MRVSWTQDHFSSQPHCQQRKRNSVREGAEDREGGTGVGEKVEGEEKGEWESNCILSTLYKLNINTKWCILQIMCRNINNFNLISVDKPNEEEGYVIETVYVPLQVKSHFKVSVFLEIS